MGVESYGVQFKPTGGTGAEVLTVEQITETLAAAGFQRLPLRTEYNPAQLASPPVGETEYERRDSESVIEALVRWEAEPGQPSRTDSLPVTSVAVRFAVGQPAAAEEQFLSVLEALMHAHPLRIAEGLPQKENARQADRPFDSSLRVLPAERYSVPPRELATAVSRKRPGKTALHRRSLDLLFTEPDR